MNLKYLNAGTEENFYHYIRLPVLNLNRFSI